MNITPEVSSAKSESVLTSALNQRTNVALIPDRANNASTFIRL